MMNSDWKMKLADKTCEQVLRTIDHILVEAGEHLDDDDLDNLKDCWEIIWYMKDSK